MKATRQVIKILYRDLRKLPSGVFYGWLPLVKWLYDNECYYLAGLLFVMVCYQFWLFYHIFLYAVPKAYVVFFKEPFGSYVTALIEFLKRWY